MRQNTERLAVNWVGMTVAISAQTVRLPGMVRDGGGLVVSFAITGNSAKGMKDPVEEYDTLP